MTDKELFGNSEQLESGHEKDHVADPNKMVEDLISRQVAINLVKDVCEAILSGCGSHYDGEDEVYDDLLEADAILKCNKEIMTALKHMPSAQQWIPCTPETMPKVREWVLCQCRAGIMDVLRLTEDGSWNKNYPHAEYMSGFVIAWMPLPDSWEGEQNE